ncbi:hypothetical protein IQ255_13525 [Pleurocapsales cyanobacterium LEGE 10410]|nr:hypothetical protein [Pleurocapsales cyanobacterium LEGE 10410]
MSRLKLFLLVLILAALSIVFVQNRELIALKLFCPDRAQSCLYQTPQLPLAIWIALFALAGMLINLLGQVLNRYSYSGSSKRKYANDLYPDTRWTEKESQEYPTTAESNVREQNSYDSTSYEVSQKPESAEHSGSTYSYKYREASDRPDQSKNTKKTSIEAEIDSNLTKDKDKQDDEDWI